MDVGAKLVLGDERVFIHPGDLELERLQRDADELVQNRNHEGASVADDLHAARARSNERFGALGLLVEAHDHEQDAGQKEQGNARKRSAAVDAALRGTPIAGAATGPAMSITATKTRKRMGMGILLFL